MKLTYTPKEGFAGPPIPWPACDHDEDDLKLAEAKVASGFFSKSEGRVPKRAEATSAPPPPPPPPPKPTHWESEPGGRPKLVED